MRAAPAFQISLSRFSVWKAWIGALTVLGVVVLVGWLSRRERVAWVDATSLLAMLSMLALAWSVKRVPALDLAWDGRAWSVRPLGQPVDAARLGELRVMIDLGPWMLLRFAEDGARFGRSTWLPVQRLGISGQWHALRCAVHAPRAAPSAAAEE